MTRWALASTILLSTAALAGPPRLDVQGRLASLAGAPVDGTYTLTLTLWDAVSSGKALFTEVHIGVPAQGGVFGATLGDVAALDPAIFEDGAPLWLGVQVETEPELARQPLASVPYAFQASYATLAFGLACTGCVTEAALAFPIPAAVTSVDGLAGGTIGGDVDLSGHQLTTFRVHNTAKPPAPCAPDTMGMMYFDTADKALKICDGAAYVAVGIAGPLGSPANPAESCKAVLAASPGAANGSYWLLGSDGVTYQATCDMVGGGWTRIVSWNRVDEGQTKADFQTLFKQDFDNMSAFEDKSGFIRWDDQDSDTGAMAYSKAALFANGGEWKVDLWSQLNSMEDSGTWFTLKDKDGNNHVIACQDNTAGQPYSAAEKQWIVDCATKSGGDHTFKQVYSGTVAGSVASFHISSLVYDGGWGDEPRLYRYVAWVR